MRQREVRERRRLLAVPVLVGEDPVRRVAGNFDVLVRQNDAIRMAAGARGEHDGIQRVRGDLGPSNRLLEELQGAFLQLCVAVLAYLDDVDLLLLVLQGVDEGVGLRKVAGLPDLGGVRALLRRCRIQRVRVVLDEADFLDLEEKLMDLLLQQLLVNNFIERENVLHAGQLIHHADHVLQVLTAHENGLRLHQVDAILDVVEAKCVVDRAGDSP